MKEAVSVGIGQADLWLRSSLLDAPITHVTLNKTQNKTKTPKLEIAEKRIPFIHFDHPEHR